MKVFISWSGQLSKNLAETIRQWLPAVLQAVKPYYSPDDISKGVRWNNDVANELAESKIGILCITRDNFEAPWIMFEAGALSKNLENSKVCPILFELDPTDVQGPLVQFQSAKFSKDEMKRVIKMINSELENSLSIDVLDSVFEMWWPKLKEKVDILIKEALTGNKNEIRSQKEMIEEILSLTRSYQFSKRRSSTEVSSRAVEDLVIGFRDMVSKILLSPTSELITILFELSKPIKHILFVAEISNALKNDLDEIFTSTMNDLNLHDNMKIHRNSDKKHNSIKKTEK